MVKLAMYSLLIVITFFGVGAFSGKLFVKFPDREQREEKLMWIFLTFLMMYFASGFCIQMITGHKGFTLSLVETITMQKVAPIAGLFLCAAVIFALEIPAAGLLKKGVEKQKSMLISAGVSVVSAVILFVWKRAALTELVIGGKNFTILGILVFGIFYYAGFYLVYKRTQERAKVQPVSLKKEESLWKQKVGAFAKKHPVLCYMICYTGGFLVLVVIVFSTMILSNKALVWKIDAMPQYFPYLKYMAKFLRESVVSMLHGDFNLKMYDFTIGMGEDLRSVVRTYPTNFLGVFVPDRYMEVFYNFLMVLRYYLAGLAFTAYCRYRKKPWIPTCIVSYVYIFSGYIMCLGIRHPIFTAPLIYLPMLLIALDRLITDRKVLMYSLFVGISMFTNYYFLYINTVAMGVYALIRFAQTYKKDKVKEFFAMMVRIILSYLLGCCMGAVSFLPTIVRTLNSDRVGLSNAKIATDNLLFYYIQRPGKILAGLISNSYVPEYDSCLGFVALMVPALVVFFLNKKKEERGLKGIIILEYIALLVPFCAFAMSGFSTISNRWVYIVTFTLSYMMVLVFDDLRSLSKIQVIILCVVTVAYYPICKYMIEDNVMESETTFRMLVGAVLLILLINCMKKITKMQYYTAMMVFIVVSLAVHGRMLYDLGGVVDTFMYNGSISVKFERSPYLFFTDISDDNFYRVDTSSADDEFENTGLVLDYNGVSMYNSVINKGMVKYHKDLDSIGISAVHRIYSFDNRTALEALANVRYYMIRKESTQNLPYGFSKYKDYSTKTNEYTIYKNDYPLSIGYTYDKYIDSEEYEKLSAIEKQQVMLESAVLDTKNVKSLAKGDTRSVSDKIKYGKVTVKDTDCVIVKEDRIRSKKEESTLTLSYEKKKGYEAYLMLDGVTTKKARIKAKISTDDMAKNIVIRNNNLTYALGRDSYLINLGYSDTSEAEDVTFTIPIKAKVNYSDVKVCYVPMDDYVSQIEERNEESLQNVLTDKNNEVSGNVTLSSDKVMVFSIPYSSGWKAYVDGKETSVFRANTMYMGINLTKGSHKVVLRYNSPGLHLGMMASAAGIIIWILLAVASKKKKQKGNQ